MGARSRWHTDTVDTDILTAQSNHTNADSPGLLDSRTSSSRRRTSLAHVGSCTETCAQQRLPKPRQRKNCSRTSAPLKFAQLKLQSNLAVPRPPSRFMLAPWKSTASVMLRLKLPLPPPLMPRHCSREQQRQHAVQRRPGMQRWQLPKRRQLRLARLKQLCANRLP